MTAMLLQFMSAPILESLWLEFDFWYFDTPFEVWILQVSTTTVSDPSRNTPGVQRTISRCFSEHHPSPSSTPYEGPIFQASRNADRSLRSMVLTTHPGLYYPNPGVWNFIDYLNFPPRRIIRCPPRFQGMCGFLSSIRICTLFYFMLSTEHSGSFPDPKKV